MRIDAIPIGKNPPVAEAASPAPPELAIPAPEHAITVRDRMVENARWRPSTSHVASPDCLRDRQPHCPCGVCTGRRG